MSNTTRRAPTNAIECLTSSVRRILWDGDREIAEISAPRDTTNLGVEELDSNVPLQPSITLGAGQYGDPNTHFGRVVYSPGLAIDQPMSVTRYEYKDAPPAGTTLSWAPFTQRVLWDYRGTAAFGLFTDGAWAKPYQLAPGQTDCPIPGSTGADRCMLDQWAVTQSAYDQARAGTPLLSWMGSLLRNKRDGTGLEYKRNRVYDPQTGRFTQEDPIGLAGGLNLYGFANGDPVNFSDPFGLCPWCRVVERLGAVASSVGRFGQQIATAVRRFAASPSGQQASGLVDDLAERVAARSQGAWDVAVSGGKHAGILRNYASRAIDEIQTGIASLEGQVAVHLGKIRDPSASMKNWSSLDPRAQQGYLRFWENEAVNYAQQAEVLRGMLRP